MKDLIGLEATLKVGKVLRKELKKGIRKELRHLYIARSNDLQTILVFKKHFEQKSLSKLVDDYNKIIVTGIVGVHEQALMLIALRKEFLERINESPLVLEDNMIISLNGKVELVNKHLKPLEPS